MVEIVLFRVIISVVDVRMYDLVQVLASSRRSESLRQSMRWLLCRCFFQQSTLSLRRSIRSLFWIKAQGLGFRVQGSQYFKLSKLSNGRNSLERREMSIAPPITR